MSGRKLFIKRFVQEWNFQWGVIRSVLDWSVMLYLVIPVILFVPFLYVDAWQYVHIYWNEKLPISVLLLVVFLLSVSGNFRTYLLEADLLYLMQRKTILHQLKLYGFLSSSILIILGVTLVFILILPILILIYKFSLTEILLLYLAVNAFRFLFLTLKKIINRTLYKWMIYPLTFIVSILMILNINSVIYGIGSILCIFVIFIFHLTQITKTNRWFLKEIEIENIERNRYIKLILNFSMEVEKEINNQKKGPLLFFRESRRIFKTRTKENGLLEILLKVFLRNKSYLTSYCHLMIITISAIIVLPVWLKWVVFICFTFFINSWLRSLYKKMLASHFFVVVPYNKDLLNTVWIRFKKWMSLPVIILTGVLTFLLTILGLIG
ncbi:ABC transporter permease [Peribacillus frigoritolerans]|uniref:ABC transporter permease n=1 Tax=Peribacillus frigoritolerans TaxID=450367 RepID=UPI00345D8403